MVTSSAVVGSSAIRRRGLQASAMAIITRWLHAARHLVGNEFSWRAGAGMPTWSNNSMVRLRRFCRLPPSCTFSVSPIWNPMVKQGLRLVMGSWNTMAMSLPVSFRRCQGQRQQIDVGERQAFGRTRPG